MLQYKIIPKNKQTKQLGLPSALPSQNTLNSGEVTLRFVKKGGWD